MFHDDLVPKSEKGQVSHFNKTGLEPVASLLRQVATAGYSRIAKRLPMGRSGSVSRLVSAAARHAPTIRELKKQDYLLKCGT